MDIPGVRRGAGPPDSCLGGFITVVGPRGHGFNTIYHHRELLCMIFLPSYVGFILAFLLHFNVLIGRLVNTAA